MTNHTLDRSTSVQKLKDAECPPLLAEAIVDIVSINRSEVPTKSDFEAMNQDIVRLDDGIKRQREDIREQSNEIKKQTEEITNIGRKVNNLNYEFQGLRKDLIRVEEKAELRWKAQQAETQVLDVKIEAIDSKLDTKLEAFGTHMDTRLDGFESRLEAVETNVDTKLEAFEAKFSAFQNKVFLATVVGVLMAVGVLEGIEFLKNL